MLQFECKTLGNGLNSGIFFRCIPGQYQNGYEAQIQNAFRNDDRTKPVDFGTGAIYRRVAARKVVSNDNEWFTMTVVADGKHICDVGERLPDRRLDRRPQGERQPAHRVIAPPRGRCRSRGTTDDRPALQNIRIAEPRKASSVRGSRLLLLAVLGFCAFRAGRLGRTRRPRR